MPHIAIDDLLARNRDFAASPEHVPQPFTKEQAADSAHTIIVCCFDPRAFPEQFFKINPRVREIVSIRNAGGHTHHIVPDIISLDNLLRIQDIIVIHHTDCGLTHTTQEIICRQLKEYVTEEEKTLGDYEKFDFGCMTAASSRGRRVSQKSSLDSAGNYYSRICL